MRGKITFQHLEIKVGPNEVLQKFQHGKVAKDENQKLYFIIMIFGLMTGNTTERSRVLLLKKKIILTGMCPPGTIHLSRDVPISIKFFPPIERLET